MAAAAQNPQIVYQETLVNHLVAMARTVERSVQKSLDALLRRADSTATTLASEIFLLEPKINEAEMMIDEHAVRILRSGNLTDEEIRLTVAAVRINNDLERMGDLAVNIAERVISLEQMGYRELPEELPPMIAAVRAMVSKGMGSLIFRNLTLATEVLESDDVVDRYRDQIFERLLSKTMANPEQISPNFQFILASRYLERLADHATNIAEDAIFWLRGLDVRHGRALTLPQMREQLTQDS